MNVEITSTCTMCGKESRIFVTEKQYEKIQKRYYGNNERIQDVAPELHPFEREFFITGMCFNCQSKLYNLPKPGDESWGVMVGSCPVCDCALWNKDHKDGVFTCPSCNSKVVKDENGNLMERD